ncbi:MAG: LamG domain-containing protein [Planctomycetota bacterium]
MCKKLIYLVSFVLVLGVALTSTAEAELVGWWRFDEGSGTTAFDLSEYGNDGILQGDPQWVNGKFGKALQFNGIDEFVEVPHAEILTVDSEVTVMAWINTERHIGPTGDNWQGIMAKGPNPGRSYSLYTQVSGALHFSTGGVGTLSTMQVPLNEWVHVAAQVINGGHQYYINGEPAGTSGSGITLPGASDTATVRIGTARDANREFLGMIDDVRIYNEALTQEEIQVIMQGAGMPFAFAPTPADGVLHEDTWASLGWRPGDEAASHDVYFGENFNDVNDGAEGTFYGNQTSTFFVVGFPGFPYPEGLVPGKTYYWRIDELEADGTTKHKGNVWSFMVPPKTAYAPDPADGAELVDPNVELSWTAGFGGKLHYVYFGDNFDDVNSATGGLPLGAISYTPGTLKMAKTYYWRVDEFDIIETHKGDVWSFTTEGGVGSPDPSNGAVDVKQTPVLTWLPGFYAASHQVYFGTDKEVVRNADTGSPEYKGTGDLGAESYDPGKLELDVTYYWRIDEVNNVNPDSPWVGNVWSFTTANFLIVDDFEDYDIGNNEIWWSWIDGLGYASHPTLPAHPGNGTGSMVGDENTGSYMEETIVHGGNQSMPVFYDNSILGYSEVEKTLTYPRDWTENGISTLTIWFTGDSANAAETLYVALNGNAVVYHGNPNAAQVDTWTEWNIDLQGFADQGVNLANVNTIALGLGNKSNPQAGGSGVVYFDDIRLYRPAEPAP